MKEQAEGTKGVVRDLTPEEIGRYVRHVRESREIKRFTLAQEAGISEKSVERLENGIRVSEEVYRKVTLALGYREDAFLGLRYIPTREEAVVRVVKAYEELDAKYLIIDAKPFKEELDMRAVLDARGATLVNYSEVKGEAADLAADFQQNLVDWKDIANDITEPERRKACRSLFAEIQKIEQHGYVARYGIHEPEFRLGKEPTLKMPTSVITFVPRGNWQLSLKQMAVPRVISEVA